MSCFLFFSLARKVFQYVAFSYFHQQQSVFHCNLCAFVPTFDASKNIDLLRVLPPFRKNKKCLPFARTWVQRRRFSGVHVVNQFSFQYCFLFRFFQLRHVFFFQMCKTKSYLSNFVRTTEYRIRDKLNKLVKSSPVYK